MGRRIAPPRSSSAFVTVDFDKPGKQVGFVMVPHSPHDDAWGATRVPIGIIKNGEGPTVILEGGNHGDEYEGPIAICEMIRDLDPGEIQGRIILMPANNVHAVIAGRRTSSVDGLNFNRAFPGDPRGSITEQIAAFVSDEIFPRGRCLSRLAFRRLVASHQSERHPRADRRCRTPPQEHRGGACFRCAADRRHRQSRRTAHRHGCRLPRRADHRRHGDGRRRHRLARGARDLPARRAKRSRPSWRAFAGDGRAAARRRTHPRAPGRKRFRLCDDRRHLRTVPRTRPCGQRRRARWPHPYDLGSDPQPRNATYQADGILYGRRQPGRVRPGNCCLVVAAPYAGAL